MVANQKKTKLFWMEEQEIFQKLYNAIFTAESPVAVLYSSAYGNFDLLKINLAKNPADILLIGAKHISAALFQEISQTQREFPGLGIVLFTSILYCDDLLLIRQHLENTRSPFGFFFKKSLSRTEQIFSIISLVKMGQIIIDPSLSKLIMTEKDKTLIAGGLTSREMEILNLVAKGYTNVAISHDLCIDIKTVRHHINNIYSKLQTTDKFDNKHPRVSATNIYHRLTGQLSLEENIIDD